MRSMFIAGTIVLLTTGSAFAQYGNTTRPQPSNPAVTAPAPAAKDGPSNPAVKTTEGNNPGAPVAGANSFTEGQAKSRIESKGYTNVTALVKDDRGVWHGKADKGGKSFNVALDYQGNVVER
jgi:hypothetical protein